MTDLEMTKLCAVVMGCSFTFHTDAHDGFVAQLNGRAYDPLHDDAQAMALVKKLKLNIVSPYVEDAKAGWEVYGDGLSDPVVINADLNRAIIECVAKMQADTRSATPSVSLK